MTKSGHDTQGTKIQFADVYYKGPSKIVVFQAGVKIQIIKPNMKTNHKPTWKQTKEVVTSNDESVHILTQKGNKYTDRTRLTMNSWEQWWRKTAECNELMSDSDRENAGKWSQFKHEDL